MLLQTCKEHSAPLHLLTFHLCLHLKFHCMCCACCQQEHKSCQGKVAGSHGG
jgi:hypothetical protein